MNVNELMQSKVISVNEKETLAEVYQLMGDHKFRHVPVVNEDREVVGIISERDMLRTYIEGASAADLGRNREAFLYEHPVVEIMSQDPETIEADASLADACRMMLENKFDCLPVVDGQRLVGILTTSDILMEMVKREEG